MQKITAANRHTSSSELGPSLYVDMERYSPQAQQRVERLPFIPSAFHECFTRNRGEAACLKRNSGTSGGGVLRK